MFKVYLFLLSILLISCASTQKLYNRGLSKQDRIAYVDINYEIGDPDIKKSFIKGKLCLGMPKPLVINLIGPPINSQTGTTWKYPLIKGEGTIEFEKGLTSSISKNLLEDPEMYE